jgi:hypothetical protein
VSNPAAGSAGARRRRERTITTLIGDEITQVTRRLAAYEIIGATGVRPLLRTLNVDPGDRRLAELGPPQKTRQLNRRGRTLAITTTLLVQGSCGISRPFGDDRTVRGYLQRGEHTKVRRRLEADAKSLLAFYQYGRLHGAVRLRWGFLDEMLPAPWIHRDEPTLHQLLQEAYTRGVSLDVVVGSVPGWTDPWSRVRQAFPATDAWGWPSGSSTRRVMRFRERTCSWRDYLITRNERSEAPTRARQPSSSRRSRSRQSSRGDGPRPLESFAITEKKHTPKLAMPSMAALNQGALPGVPLTDADRDAAIGAMRIAAEKRTEGNR